MPRRKKENKLLQLAKLIIDEIKNFADEYDIAEDKKAFMLKLGDHHRLYHTNSSLWNEMMDAVGLNDGVLEEVENFIRNDVCATINEKIDHDHTNALIDFVTEEYMNVS